MGELIAAFAGSLVGAFLAVFLHLWIANRRRTAPRIGPLTDAIPPRNYIPPH